MRARQTEEHLCAQAASVERERERERKRVCETEGWRCFALNGTLTGEETHLCVKLQGVSHQDTRTVCYSVKVYVMCDCGTGV